MNKVSGTYTVEFEEALAANIEAPGVRLKPDLYAVANTMVTVNYDAAQATSGYLMILNAVTGISNSYIVNPAHTSTAINVSNYAVGAYTVVLVCDGQVADAKGLSIN